VLQPVLVAGRRAAPSGPDELNLILGSDPPGGRGERCRQNRAFAWQQIEAPSEGMVERGDGVADFGTRPHQPPRIAQDAEELRAVRRRVPQIAPRIVTADDDHPQVFGDHRLQMNDQLSRVLLQGSCSFRQPNRISAIARRWISLREIAEAIEPARQSAPRRVG